MFQRALLPLLCVLMACSGNHRAQNREAENTPVAQQVQVLNSGLQIENNINRGINYTDPQGNDLSIRYIPITLTNDTTQSIAIQIAFSENYHFPAPIREAPFKLIPMSKEWAMDGIEISEKMKAELPVLMADPVLNTTIAPGEQIIMAIGSVYPRPTQSPGVLPRILFTHNETGLFPECDWHMAQTLSSAAHIPLGLKIIFGEICEVIACGKISYPQTETEK